MSDTRTGQRRAGVRRRFLVPLIILVAAIVIIMVTVLWLGAKSGDSSSSSVGAGSAASHSAEAADTSAAAAARRDAALRKALRDGIGNPLSPFVLVNKTRPLTPIDFRPNDLTAPTVISNPRGLMLGAEAAAAIDRLAAAAAAEGIGITLESAYRSYQTQAALFSSYAASDGEAAANRYSARAGHSEHQTGFAADVGQRGGPCPIEVCFADTAAGKWVAANSWKYGFIVRYEQGYEHITGYTYEPWHLRYIGAAAAADYHQRGFHTYEQYTAELTAAG